MSSARIVRDLELGLDLDVTQGSNASQSISALMQARSRGLVTYRGPLNMRNPVIVDTFQQETQGRAELPTDDGQYYWIYIKTGVDREPLPLLLREGTALAFLRAHHALTVAAKMDLLNYEQPVDPAAAGASEFLHEEFGEPVTIDSTEMHFLITDLAGDHKVLLAASRVVEFIVDQWALETAENANMLTYYGPKDLSLTANREDLLDQCGTDTELPERGVHFVVSVLGRSHAFIPLGDGVKVAFGIALGSGNTGMAASLAYQDGIMQP